MKAYKELKCYKNLKKKTNELASFLAENYNDFFKNNYDFLKNIADLSSKLKKYYTKNPETGRYPVITEKQLAEIKSNYTNVSNWLKYITDEYNNTDKKKTTKLFNQIKTMVDSDINALNKIDFRNHLSLPSSVYKISKETGKNSEELSSNYKWPGFWEYSKIYMATSKPESEVLDEFLNKSPKEIADNYKKAIESNPRFYEYTNMDSVPVTIRNTSDYKAIEGYLEFYGDSLTYPQVVHLRNQANSARKAEEIKNHTNDIMAGEEAIEIGQKPEVVSKREDHAELKIKQPEHQTSGNGCWSVSAQMLVASRGFTNVTQQDIRAYRPDYNKMDEPIFEHGYTDKEYHTDGVKNMLEMGDSILEYAPNSMLHQLDIQRYSRDVEKSGISREEYINDTVKLMKNHILHAIKNDKSPVSLLIPGHYITITGIDGDTIMYKDSVKRNGNDPDHTYKTSLKDFISKQFSKSLNEKNVLGFIQLTWISDINLSKDGKTIYGLPSLYTEMKEDGSITLPPEDIQNHADNENMPTNMNGTRIYAAGNDESSHISNDFNPYSKYGVSMIEKVYMPKKVNAAYLKKVADKRSPEEEARLNRINTDFYSIPNNKEAGKKRIDDIRNNREPEVEIDIKPVPNKPQLEYIKNLADDLQKELSKHEHFWLYKPSEHYSNLIEDLWDISDECEELSAKRDKISFNSLMKKIDKAIKDSRHYLTHKQDQFTKDPMRKNDSGKQNTEQNRIKGAIDAFDKLSTLQLSIKKSYTDAEIYQGDYTRVNNITKTFQRDLVSNTSDPEKQYKDTYFNRINGLNKTSTQAIANMDAIWAPKGEFLPEFKNSHLFGLKGKTPEKVFSKIKTINDTLPTIGKGGKNDKLTDKDFAAIAVAASTSLEIVQDEVNSMVNAVEELQPHVNEEIAYANINFIDAELSTGEIRERAFGTDKTIKRINNSKIMAKNALISYKNGDKKPLAKILATGLNNISNAAAGNNIATSLGAIGLCEMGERMIAMLDRDPDLMKEAVKSGLKPNAFKNIYTLERVSKMKSHFQDDITVDQNNAKPKEWSREEKIEKYTDMIFAKLILDSAEYVTSQKNVLENNNEYRQASDTFDNKKTSLNIKHYKEIINKHQGTFAGIAETKADYRKLNDDLKTAENNYKKNVDIINNSNNKDKAKALKDLEDKFKNKKAVIYSDMLKTLDVYSENAIKGMNNLVKECRNKHKNTYGEYIEVPEYDTKKYLDEQSKNYKAVEDEQEALTNKMDRTPEEIETLKSINKFISLAKFVKDYNNYNNVINHYSLADLWIFNYHTQKNPTKGALELELEDQATFEGQRSSVRKFVVGYGLDKLHPQALQFQNGLDPEIWVNESIIQTINNWKTNQSKVNAEKINAKYGVNNKAENKKEVKEEKKAGLKK
ncbi:MAG: hypothetical protein K6E10_00345 [Eubacterium sp.]|nr:hypothetical protein [Eubacterium sp.]